MKLVRYGLSATIAVLAAVFCHAGSATDVTGLFYTGVNNSGSLLNGGSTDSHWTVTYARVNGSGSTSSSYTGAAYVVSSSYIDSAWVQNTSNAQWITAPGAINGSGTTNVGGDYLPGNGTSGTNSAYFVYRLAFTISGTGSGSVSNNIAISMTIAADDQYSVYVNPASAPTVNSYGSISAGGTSASASGTSAWDNTTSFTLANYNSGSTTDNSSFVIGTNYIYVVVANTNSQTGSSSSTSVNPSGLLVYQVGSAVIIDGHPIPEVGAWMPLGLGAGVVLLYRLKRKHRSNSSPV